jgi:DNA-binding GntR family transcriptional regulator
MKISEIQRPKSLTDEAYQRLRAAIRGGTLEMHRFYQLGEVAARFGISRTPVREAVLKLAHEGLLEMLPQRGFRLRQISLAEANEIFELRGLLEGRTVEKLAEKGSSDEVRQLRKILKRQDRFVNEPRRFLEIDEEFHLTMLDLAGFHRAREFLATIRDVIWSLSFEALSTPGRLDHVISEHAHIVDCIESGKPSAARSAIDLHLQRTYAEVRTDRDPDAQGLGPDRAVLKHPLSGAG